MLKLVVEIYWELSAFEILLARHDFAGLYAKVRNSKVASKVPKLKAVTDVTRAVDLVCVCYWKEVLCLQRSAVITLLLRRRGIKAEMIIGAQQMPFRAHAWVEVENAIVNDKPYVSEIYRVLDRC